MSGYSRPLTCAATCSPYDYYTAKPAPRGLAKIATLIAQERNANTLLVDCGDTIQGSPLETVHQAEVRSSAKSADPMMLAMNALHYDAMTVGNHEFNYGLRNLNATRKTAQFPWLAANVDGDSAFAPFIIKTVGGVRVAIIGVTASHSRMGESRKLRRPPLHESC